MDKEGHKLWKLAKCLNNEETRVRPTTLLHEENLLTEKKVTSHFADIYERTNHLEEQPERKTDIKNAQKQLPKITHNRP
jgi:hypothetical protein